MNKREVRFSQQPELRANIDSKTIQGYAAVFNSWSPDLGGFTERVLPGAFTRSLASPDLDVICAYNHNTSQVLGRTQAGTLRLMEDDKGLMFQCDPPNTQLGRDIPILIARGDLSGCSFCFSVKEDRWKETKSQDGSINVTRELVDLDLYDVGPVTFPVYTQTDVGMRSLWPDGMPESVDEYIRKTCMRRAKKQTDMNNQLIDAMDIETQIRMRAHLRLAAGL